MADVLVEDGDAEPERGVGLAPQEHEHLPEPEEIEVVDEEGADEHESPARQG